MTEPRSDVKTRGDAWFERVSALLIGLVAVLAAVLAFEQSIQSYAGDRAQQQASRLAADASAKVSATSLEGAFEPRALQDSIVLALLRRILGPFFGFLRTNFVFVRGTDAEVFGELNRKFTLLDRYVLDLSADTARAFDRRVAVALGIMLDTGERR